MTLAELLPQLAGLPGAERRVARIATDSRELDAATWWLAARGIRSHALDHCPVDLDCAGVIYEPPYQPIRADWIACPDLGEQLGAIAARFYHHPSQRLCVFAVTGTDGKSSLVHLLAQARGAAMIGTIGIGALGALAPATQTTPDALSVQRLLADFVAAGQTHVAMEVSSHALMQGRVNGVEFAIAVFTNLSRDHLDYHQNMEDYFRAKARLFAYPLKHAVVNLDDAHGRRLIDEARIHPQATLWTVSSRGHTHPRADHHLSARDIHLSAAGLDFILSVDGDDYAIHSPLLARFNVDNLLNVAACLLADGYQAADLPTGFAALHGVPGRVERLDLGDDRLALIDYAHTPGALQSALQGVRAHVRGQLWVIFGCGGNRDHGKRPLMAAAAEAYADRVVISDDNPREEDPAAIVADIVAGLRHPERVDVIQPRDAAICSVLNRLAPGDAVLIAGKGHENYQIIGTTKHPYSDQAVVRGWQASS